MITCVVDTNVVLVANGQHQAVSPDCVASCAVELQNIMRRGQLVLDAEFAILLEYQNKTQPRKGNRPGDVFVKWALNNRCNSKHVHEVALIDHISRGFESFPADSRLENFDASDKKFVAVSRAHPKSPPIKQAADSKWLAWSKPLKDHGVVVEFLCKNDIARFRDNKSKPPSKYPIVG